MAFRKRKVLDYEVVDTTTPNDAITSEYPLSKAKAIAKKAAFETGHSFDIFSFPGNKRVATIHPSYKRKSRGTFIGPRDRNPTQTLGDWQPCHAIRTLPTGEVQILREKNPGKVNFGFKDVKGVFHSLTSKVAKGAKRLVSKRRKNPKRTMKTYDVYWGPEGRKIATVTASTQKAAKSKAPLPYRKYKGEIYVTER
jgi:hypothetical protein